MSVTNKAITLLSGGLDSMVSTAIARSRGVKVVLALTFDYGQRAAKREISAAGKLCKLWRIKHKVIKLPWLGEITNTALVNSDRNVPIFEARSTKHEARKMARAVWVPNRNGLFINIAAGFAESLGAELIITGFNKEEAATFPDNGKKFVHTINETLKHGTLKHPKVKSYTQQMSKRGMAKYAVKNRLPLDLCWPCYEGGKELCDKCESCARFMSAFNGIMTM